MKHFILTALSTGIALTAAAASAESLPADSARTHAFRREAAAASVSGSGAKSRGREHFLPTRRRIDREIDKLKFAYKGEVIMGLTASYGTLSSDDTDIMLIVDGIGADGSVATVKPFVGYFYRDNNCVGVRFGYRHMGGTLDSGNYDFGESNDLTGALPYLDLASDNYSFGIFHRSYAGLDPKGRF